MSLYLDTSVLVSIYIPEKHSESIINLLQESPEKPCVSRLAEVEFFAALALKKRIKELQQAQINAAVKLFHHHLDQLIYEKIYITDVVFTSAMQLLSEAKSPLRTLDALHLACSSIIQATLVTADKFLYKSAKIFNIPSILL